MTLSDLVGRRVKVARWDYAQFLAAFTGRLPILRVPQGRVTHIEMTGKDVGDVWVKLDGLKLQFAFAHSQLELLR